MTDIATEVETDYDAFFEGKPPMGAVFNVGGVLALYWPSVHPCHPPKDQWVLFHPEGRVQLLDELGSWVETPTADTRILGRLPGVSTPEPEWLDQDRFADFREAVSYARSHFSQAAESFGKVRDVDAFWIWKTVETGMDRIAQRTENELTS